MYTKKYFAKSGASGVTLGFIICFGIWAFHFIDGPVAAGAAMVDPNKADVAVVVKPRTLQGLNFELQYPGAFDLTSRLNNDKLALEQYNIGQSSKKQFTMALSVHPLESGLLNDDSNWRIRALDTKSYVTNNEKLHDETVGIMSRVDKTEKSLFWVHKGKVLIVSLSTNDPNEDLPGILAVIKPTIRWRT
jgi:hypothetical protein